MRPYDRHGIIAFTLTASTEQALGNVLMISDRFGSPYQGYPRGPDPSAPREPRTELMTIQFVRADDGQISGRLDRDLGSQSPLSRVRLVCGSVHGDIMRGTFSSVCERITAGRRMDGGR